MVVVVVVVVVFFFRSFLNICGGLCIFFFRGYFGRFLVRGFVFVFWSFFYSKRVFCLYVCVFFVFFIR